jgi:hypothetical protein
MNKKIITSMRNNRYNRALFIIALMIGFNIISIAQNNSLKNSYWTNTSPSETLACMEYMKFVDDSNMIVKFSHVDSPDPLKPYIFTGKKLFIGDFEFNVLKFTASELEIEMTDEMYSRISGQKAWLRKRQTFMMK